MDYFKQCSSFDTRMNENNKYALKKKSYTGLIDRVSTKTERETW